MKLAMGRFARWIGTALAVLVFVAVSAGASEDDLLKVSPPAAQVQSGGSQASPDGAENSLNVRRVGIALAVVLGTILSLRWIGQRLLRGRGAGRDSKAISIVSRTILSPKQQVMLLKVGKRLIVVADSGGQMSALCQITEADEVAGLIGQVGREESVSAKSFASLFRGREQGLAEANDGGLGHASEAASEESEPEGEVAAMHEDIRGLLGKVQMLREQFKTTESGT